jgi:hypothetical protein
MVCAIEIILTFLNMTGLILKKIIMHPFRFDWRLIFVNLKKDERHTNIIGTEEREIIWIPNLIFDNSVEDVQISNDPFSSLVVNNSGSSTIILNDNLQEDEQYHGFDNGITYTRVYKMKLLCIFEQHKYPFDSQSCFVKVEYTKCLLTI